MSQELEGNGGGLARRAADAATPASAAGDGMLRIDERTIRAVARRFCPRHVAIEFLRQGWRERMLRRMRRIHFRHRANESAVAAYCAMEVDEFADINARQRWANWRTIPRNLSGRLPDRPVLAVDLCCGIGDSTAVLAWYCASGSRIVGLEYNPAFVARAAARSFANRIGNAEVTFRAQSVLETFRAADGSPLADRSVDLVNASGAIGCHFDEAATARLAEECARVVRPGGLATIDSGKDGTADAELVRIFAGHGFAEVGRAKSSFLDRFTQVCMRRSGG